MVDVKIRSEIRVLLMQSCGRFDTGFGGNNYNILCWHGSGDRYIGSHKQASQPLSPKNYAQSRGMLKWVDCVVFSVCDVCDCCAIKTVNHYR